MLVIRWTPATASHTFTKTVLYQLERESASVQKPFIERSHGIFADPVTSRKNLIKYLTKFRTQSADFRKQIKKTQAGPIIWIVFFFKFVASKFSALMADIHMSTTCPPERYHIDIDVRNMSNIWPTYVRHPCRPNLLLFNSETIAKVSWCVLIGDFM